MKKEEQIKKQIITCKRCGKTRVYLLRKKPNYCTWCGHKFTFFEKLTFHTKEKLEVKIGETSMTVDKKGIHIAKKEK